MPRTLDGLVANHTEAARRRLAGRPIWDEKITAKRIDGGPFEQNRDAFVAALESSKWLKRQEVGDELHELWDEIKDAEDVGHFDHCLDAIYDLADEERIWIEFDKQHLWKTNGFPVEACLTCGRSQSGHPHGS